ncbi:MAG: tetratricopeptide repeat protein [Candidatus Lokiarchaeota archaeon]|nr:tetratricopeptide repeat protein [Candidatus Lokiarchaeota archaeon]
MVAEIDYFEKSKVFFKEGDVSATLESYKKVIEHLHNQKEHKLEIIEFLTKIRKYCQENNLIIEEATVLRALGRTHSKFKNHIEGLKFSYQALKIQKKLGKKQDVAESLGFLAEDLEVSGNYDECIKIFNEASEIFKDLGNLRKVKEIEKEITRLKAFSETIIEDEYLMNKFHVDKY